MAHADVQANDLAGLCVDGKRGDAIDYRLGLRVGVDGPACGHGLLHNEHDESIGDVLDNKLVLLDGDQVAKKHVAIDVLFRVLRVKHGFDMTDGGVRVRFGFMRRKDRVATGQDAAILIDVNLFGGVRRVGAVIGGA